MYSVPYFGHPWLLPATCQPAAHPSQLLEQMRVAETSSGGSVARLACLNRPVDFMMPVRTQNTQCLAICLSQRSKQYTNPQRENPSRFPLCQSRRVTLHLYITIPTHRETPFHAYPRSTISSFHSAERVPPTPAHYDLVNDVHRHGYTRNGVVVCPPRA